VEGHDFAPLIGFIQTRQWDKAWEEFTKLQGGRPASADLLLAGSKAAFGRRDLFRARQLAEEALKLYGPSDPPKQLGQIRFHLGMVTRELGDSHVALEQFTLFLQDLSGKYPQLSMGEGKAHFYLALTLRQRRDPEGAILAYHHAIDCFRRDGLPSLLCAGLQNLAWLFCTLNRSDEARTCLEESDQLVTSPEDRIHQTLGEAHLATVEGAFSTAMEHCEAIFRRVERGEPVTAEEQSQAAWVAATVALEQHSLNTANALADIALTFATEAQDARLINDANAIRREVHLRKRPGA
jgi:tetratricopeptide (TPR) repeat protein